MTFSDNNRVSAFLGDLQSISPEKLEQILTIRKLFQNANSTLDEDIKYGGLVFYRNDELIAGIFTYKQHISIEFSNGAQFADPDRLLEGSGKYRRHLKIRHKQDIDTKNVAHFVVQSVQA